jgi:hypothetical protein
VLESTRSIERLHEVDLLMRTDESTKQFILFGELTIDGDLYIIDNESVELWQSPLKLRTCLRLDLMHQVVAEMKACTGSWSVATAAKALFLSANRFNSSDKVELLSEIQSCWGADPICTSVVIIFWQQYLCKVANGLHAPAEAKAHASDLILKFMPLKADRSLPGDVLRVLNECGWLRAESAPRAMEEDSSIVPSPPWYTDPRASPRPITPDRPVWPQTPCSGIGQLPRAESVESLDSIPHEWWLRPSSSLQPCSANDPLPRADVLECPDSSLESIPLDSRAVDPCLPPVLTLQPRTNARRKEDDTIRKPVVMTTSL